MLHCFPDGNIATGVDHCSTAKTNVPQRTFLQSSTSTRPEGTASKEPSGEKSNLRKNDLKVSS